MKNKILATVALTYLIAVTPVTAFLRLYNSDLDWLPVSYFWLAWVYINWFLLAPSAYRWGFKTQKSPE